MAKRKSKPEKNDQSLPKRLLQGLNDADVLIGQERWAEAQELLRDLDRRFPDQPEVLAPLAHVCIEQQKWVDFLYASERLAPHSPDDPDLQLALAGAYLSSGFPASALIAMRAFLQRWPKNEDTGEAQQMLAELQDELQKQYAQESGMMAVGERGEGVFLDWVKSVRDREQVENLAIQGRFHQAITQGESFLTRNPDFVPMLNTLGTVYWLSGQVEKAIACVQRAVSLHPDDALALGNLAKFSLLSGKIADAETNAKQLKDNYSTSYVHAAKAVEVLAYLGDHVETIRVFEWLQQEDALDVLGPAAGNLYHLAATAQAHMGEFKKARKLWKKALELSPDLENVQENLEDLEKPIGMQNGPYAYAFQKWLTPKAFDDLQKEMQAISKDNKDQIVFERAMRRWVARHPEVYVLASFMLRSVNESGREFLLSLADITHSAELYNAVKEFALGQSGREELRLAAANQAAYAGLLPTGTHRLWLDGQWTETLLIGIDLVSNIDRHHAPKVEKWLRAALNSARDGQYKQAEALLRQALEIEPESPDLLFNLAAAYQNQRRFAESEMLLEQVVADFPEYVFASASLAQLYISRNQLERAHQLLGSLHQVKQMSRSEFDAFCAAHIDLFLAEKDGKAAQAWFGVWESADPQNPKLERYKSIVR